MSYTDISPTELQGHVDEMFPEGISRHGDSYFLNNKSSVGATSPSIEILFEYVRRACYPDEPSRFQSFFAFESLESAKLFRIGFGCCKNTIWKVHAMKAFRADMNLLAFESTVLRHSYYANLYWQGRPGSDPFWEMLLVPPIHILNKVEESFTGRS